MKKRIRPPQAFKGRLLFPLICRCDVTDAILTKPTNISGKTTDELSVACNSKRTSLP